MFYSYFVDAIVSEGEGRLSARWRRSRKSSRWLDIFRDFNVTNKKGRPKIFRTKNSRIKMRASPHRCKLLESNRENWKEPKPLIDILEENDEIIVVTEFAGFQRENLTIHVKNQRLTLSAENADRKYHKSLNLPRRVIPETIRTEFKNGVLEIRLKKGAEEKTIDKIAG